MTEPRDRTLTPLDRSQRDPRPAQGWLSAHREQQLRDGLRELPELGALAVAALPGEHLGGEGGARGVPGSRPPLNVAALDLFTVRTSAIVVGDPVGEADLAYRIGSRKQAMRDTLESWCWLAHDEMLEDGQQPMDPRGPRLFVVDPAGVIAGPWWPISVSAACAWLLRHIVWILDQQWVDELAIDVALMVRECRAILRERPTYRPACPGCHATLVEEASFWHCPDCGTDHRDDRMSLRTAVALQLPMTVGELTRAFGWSSKTVESWIHRGNLQPVDDEARPRRYHVLDALRLADAGGASMVT